jgi:hypothetical protein
MPWVHEDLTTEAAVFKHFPKAKRYEGTNAGYIKFLKETKWNSYDKFSEEEKGGAAWRLQNAGGPVKMYSKSAGPYSSGRAFTRNALTWFGDGMIQMSLPYHFQSQNAHKYMVPNGDDQNHKIRVSIQFWVSRNEQECVRFDLGFFRPVRKWNQGRFWKVLLVKHGSELIDNINSMIQTTVQTSQKEITKLKKNHDKDIADKDEKIKELTDQVASLTTQNKKLKAELDEKKGELDETRGELDETRRELDETKRELGALQSERDAHMTRIEENDRVILRLQSEHDAILSQYNALKGDQDQEDVPLYVKKMEKKMEKMKEKITRLRSNNKQLGGELEETKGKIALKETELQTEKGSHQATRNELQTEKSSHQATKGELNLKWREEVQDKFNLPYKPSLPECERLMNSAKRGCGPSSGKWGKCARR